MTDIETVGSRSSAGILAISSVVFDYEDPDKNYIDEFCIYLDAKAQVKEYGRTWDQQTMDWWNDPKKVDPEVREAQFAGTASLDQGISELLEFYDKHDVEWHWAKGVHFDMPILKDAAYVAQQKRNTLNNAVESLGYDQHPYILEFWKYMCSATIGRMYEHELKDKWLTYRMTKAYNKEFGGSHDPLNDCKIQIEILKDLCIR